MRVFLIIPTFNRAALVTRAVLSAIDAHHRRPDLLLTIFVIDDGSTDDTARSVRSIVALPEGVTIIYLLQSNEGAGAARNHGLDYIFENYEVGEDDFVSFLDSDDVLMPSFFSLFERYCQPGYIVRFSRFFFSGSRPPEERITDSFPVRILNGRKALIRYLQSVNGAVGAIYPAGLWKTLRFPRTKFYEDIAATACAYCNSMGEISVPYQGYAVFNEGASITRRVMNDEYFGERLTSIACIYDGLTGFSRRTLRQFQSFCFEQALFNYARCTWAYASSHSITHHVLARQQIFHVEPYSVHQLLKFLLFFILGAGGYHRLAHRLHH